MNDTKKILFMSIKYLVAATLTVWAFFSIGKISYFLLGMAELCLIAVITNLFAQKRIGWICNSLLLFLYNVQMAVLAFSSTYITLVMITNIESVEMLSGKAGSYIAAGIVVLISSFLPIRKVVISHKRQTVILAAVLLLYVGMGCLFGMTYSPVAGYVRLAAQQYQSVQFAREIEKAVANIEHEEYLSEFYHAEVKDYYSKDTALPQQPNIILIFTEGLSQNVISDEREIMPNVKEYQNKSLNFINYYNHTFATYRGLIGQLYSGYQNSNHDTNPLVSLQAVLRNEGYRTVFLNSEPRNKEFTKYLKNFYFDELIGDTNWSHSGIGNTMSDKDMYALLYDEAEKRSASNQPFFLATYTVGTHVSFDSLEFKYQSGSDAALNKFYETDYYFGEFMKKFENSSFADNTIIIFTTDHATFADDSFRTAFPDYKRRVTALDEIPLFIYYKNISADTIDAYGRNSICFAPTVLDYLDISADNYFLGSSLFSQKVGNIEETMYTDSNMVYSTAGDTIASPEKKLQQNFLTLLKGYYVTKEAAVKGTYYYPVEDGKKTDRYISPSGYYYWAGLPVNNSWVKNGADTDPNAWYHTNESGHFVTDPTGQHVVPVTIDGITYDAIRIEFDGVVYTFDNSNGKLLLGDVVNDNGTLYYYWAGKPVTDGWFTINGVTYYAYEDGHLALGEQKINGLTYTFTVDGVNDAQLQYGAFAEKDGVRYYYWADKVVTDTLFKVKDNQYYATIDGSLATGWIEYGDYVYYAHANGAFATGAVSIDNKTYRFNEQGVLLDVWQYKTVPVYRLYKEGSVKHFYTMDSTEKSNMIAGGWIDEDIAWYAPATEGEPVYRLYNATNNDHFYTMDQGEINNLTSGDWIVEGVAFYSAPSQGTPIYRLYYPTMRGGLHHFTANEEERDNLIDKGWYDEGIGWYGVMY